MAHVAVFRLRIKLPDFPRAVPRPGERHDPRLRHPAVRGRRRHVHRDRLRRHRRAQPGGGGGRRRLAAGRHRDLLAFRRRQGLDLISTHKVAIPQPVVDHEAEYDSVLVPIARRQLRRARDGHRGQARRPPAPRDPRAGARHGAERAADRRADARRRGGRRVGDRAGARCTAGARVSGHVEKIRSGQAGRRIVEEASDMRAAAIVMPLPRARQRRVAVRQDARDRARRAAVPGDHRVGARPDARQAPRDGEGEPSYEDVTLILSSAMVVIGLAIIVRTFAEGGAIAFGIVVGRAVHRRRLRAPVPGAAPVKPLKKPLGQPALFGIVQGFIAASIYFSSASWPSARSASRGWCSSPAACCSR